MGVRKEALQLRREILKFFKGLMEGNRVAVAVLLAGVLASRALGRAAEAVSAAARRAGGNAFSVNV